ncbi:uncharacterized protein LOC143919406 [Arctopsyche grandis]|uniref:uncharacterized protein LOC143919406 n=1 Tax=Arctopsyche grandis TaxID=121162 RepID=UPI00406DA16F
MDKEDKMKVVLSDDADSTIDMSIADLSEIQDTSIAYQTADEGNGSKYFSVIEDESTLENIDNSDLSLQVDKDDDNVPEELSITLPFESSAKSENSLPAVSVDNLNKFNIHENIETTNILSGGVDMFDDNESSVDGHELVIDDDPQPSERSDDCVESSTEMSIDMQYKYEADDMAESNSSTAKNLGFSMLPKTNNVIHITESKMSSNDGDENEDSQKKTVNIKDFVEDSNEVEIKSDNYNFPDGSHRVTLLIDGNNVEAINIGQDIYIYTDNNGELTAFRVLKDDGNFSIKYLHVGKNEDGNIEVYEEQVNQITVSPDDSDPTKEKDVAKLNADNKSATDTGKSEQKSQSEIEKNSQDLIKAVMGQEKSLHKLNLENAFGIVSFSGLMSSAKIELHKSDSIELSEDSKLSSDSNSFISSVKILDSSPSKLVSINVESPKLDVSNVEDLPPQIILKDDETSLKDNENSNISMAADDTKEDNLIVDVEDSNNSVYMVEHSPLKIFDNNDDLNFTASPAVPNETKVVLDENDEKSVSNSKETVADDLIFELKESKVDSLIIDENEDSFTGKKIDSVNDQVSVEILTDSMDGEIDERPQNDESNAVLDNTLTSDLQKENVKSSESNDCQKPLTSSSEIIEKELLIDVENTSKEEPIPLEISEESTQFESIESTERNDEIQCISSPTEISVSVSDEVAVTEITENITPKEIHIDHSELEIENRLLSETNDDNEELVDDEIEEMSVLEFENAKLNKENTTEQEIVLPKDIENQVKPLPENFDTKEVPSDELSEIEKSDEVECVERSEAPVEEKKLIQNETVDEKDLSVLKVENVGKVVLKSSEDTIVNDEIKNSLVEQKTVPLESASIESDDDFDEEYVQGEPVTGDSGMDWSDGNTPVSNKIIEAKNSSTTEVVIEKHDTESRKNIGNHEKHTESFKNEKSPKKIENQQNIPVSSVKCAINDVIDNSFNKDFNTEDDNSPKNKSSLSDKCITNVNKDKETLTVTKSPSIKTTDTSKIVVPNESDLKGVQLTQAIENVITQSKKLYTYTSPSKEKSAQMSSKHNYNLLDDGDSTIETFKSFHPKSVLKTYSREVKPNLPPKKNISYEISTSASKTRNIVENKSKSTLDAQENTTINIVTTEVDSHLVEEMPTLDMSPKHKSRQPRKQVFTSVGNSDIEIIFPDVDGFKNSITDFSKPSKTYSRSKNKDNDINNSHKYEDKKTNKKAVPLEMDTNVNSSDSQISKTNTVPNSVANTNDMESTLKNSHLLNSSSEDVKNQNASSSPLSNSAKRKRGRPKKVLSSNTNIFESVILNIDGSVGKPLNESRQVTRDNVKVIVENKSKPEIIDDKPNGTLISDKEEKKSMSKSPEETGKRKKGRPRKILSASLNMSRESTSPMNNPKRKSILEMEKSDENMNDASSMSNFDKNTENICPICSKNFRSPNVLVKHAKHCNGVINFDVIRSPKRKRIEPVKSDFDAKKNNSEDDSTMLEQDETESESIIVSSDITLSEILKENREAEILEDIAEEKSNESLLNIPVKNITCEVESVDHPQDVIKIDISVPENAISQKSNFIETPLENTTPVEEDQVNLKEDKTEPKVDKSKSIPIRVPKERSVKKPPITGGKVSPMSRLSKFLNTKPPINKVIKCEICGKTFRQLAHMVYHRNKHETEKAINQSIAEKILQKINPPISEDAATQKTEPATILKCEICKKGFRKLHHLVEHREMHINNEIKSRRTSVASVKSEPEAGFRCDTCDKSFRKLHHLVEHREMHLLEANDAASKPTVEVKSNDEPKEKNNTTCTGCGKSFRKRHHMVEHRDIHCSPSKKRNSEESEMSDNNVRLSFTSSTSEESNNCGICGKSYRKLHHMIEHRESHIETSVKPSENRSSTRISMAADPLNTKDIIHECSKCYMVFPNVNSLNKHTANCLRKKVFKKLNPGANTNKSILTNGNKLTRTKSESSSTSENVNNVPKNTETRSQLSEKLSQVAEKFQKPSTSKFFNSKNKSKSKISTVAVKKPKLEEEHVEDDSKVKYKINNDDVVKYKINPAYKISRRHSQPLGIKSPSNLTPKPKLRKSDTALTKTKIPTAKVMKTILEDTTVRYSFPKPPKVIEEKTEIKQLRNTVRRSNVPLAMSLNKNIVTRAKISAKSAPTLAIKRKSLGGRKSLDGKKLLERAGLQSKLRSNDNSKRVHKDTSKMFKCDCGKQFLSEVLLKRHMDSEHTPPKSYKCQSCGVSVRTAAQFSKHKRTHEAESSSTSKAAANRVKKSPRHQISTLAKTSKTQEVKNKRTAHGGVPLSDKMKKAMAGSKF